MIIWASIGLPPPRGLRALKTKLGSLEYQKSLASNSGVPVPRAVTFLGKGVLLIGVQRGHMSCGVKTPYTSSPLTRTLCNPFVLSFKRVLTMAYSFLRRGGFYIRFCRILMTVQSLGARSDSTVPLTRTRHSLKRTLGYRGF